MAKLVHNYVFDAVQRCLHKIKIEQNVSSLCAATPALDICLMMSTGGDIRNDEAASRHRKR